MVDGFYCSCMPGYTGALCEININECASAPCEHAGQCIDVVAGFKCNCPHGFSGTFCEVCIFFLMFRDFEYHFFNFRQCIHSLRYIVTYNIFIIAL